MFTDAVCRGPCPNTQMRPHHHRRQRTTRAQAAPLHAEGPFPEGSDTKRLPCCGRVPWPCACMLFSCCHADDHDFVGIFPSLVTKRAVRQLVTPSAPVCAVRALCWSVRTERVRDLPLPPPTHPHRQPPANRRAGRLSTLPLPPAPACVRAAERALRGCGGRPPKGRAVGPELITTMPRNECMACA